MIREFLGTVNIGKIKKIKRYPKGLHNDSYKITTDKIKYSLRVYNYKKPSQIKFEIAILQKLKDLPVPQPIQIDKTQYIGKYMNKYVIIYPYLEGDHRKTYTVKQLEEVGRYIGRFHNACKDFKRKGFRYQFYYLPNHKIDRFKKISEKAKIPYLDLLPTIIQELKENVLDKKLVKGPIHVDIKPENVLFNKGKVSGILDFDNAFMGPLLLDLTKSMVWFGVEEGKFNIKRALHIYRGYIQERPLSNLEKENIYKGIKFSFLSHIFVDYYMRAINATTQEYFDFIIKNLYKAYKRRTMTEWRFIEEIKKI